MKSPTFLIVFGLALFGRGVPCYAQGTFQNLAFEQARLEPSSAVSALDALPGWTVRYDLWIPDMVAHNTVSLGAAMVSIHDRESYWQPIEGNYSVLLQDEFLFRTTPSISQTGTIPSDTKTLLFLCSPLFGPKTVLFVGFAGEKIPAVRLGAEDPYLWGADISEFAGQTGELKFWGSGMLDSISFSPSVIPEPGTAVLVLLGGIAWLSQRRWMRR